MGLRHEAPHRACDPRRARGGDGRPRRAGGAARRDASPSARPRVRPAASTARSRSPSRAAAASTRTRASSSPPACSSNGRGCPSPTTSHRRSSEPLGLSGRLDGSPAHGYRGPLGDLLARRPRAPPADSRRARDARRGDDRPVPRPRRRPARPRPDGAERLGPHLRAARREVAALDGLAQLRADVRPLRRERHVPLGRSRRGGRVRGPHRPAVRRLGEGGVARRSATPSSPRSPRSSSAKSGRRSSSNVARSQLATTAGVIADTVAVRGTSHRRRDLAEVVAGPEHATCAEIALADGQDSGEEDVEPVVGLALAHEDRARSDLLALHALPEPGERLARQPGEQLDPGELVLCGRAARRGYSS